MSQENVETVQAFFEAWNAGNTDAVVELLDADVDYFPSRKLPEARPCHGPEEVLQFIARYLDAYSRHEWAIQEVIEVGRDRFLVRVNLRIEGRDSGMKLEGDLYHCFWLRDGRFFRVEDHMTLSGALHALGLEGGTLEAVGLSEQAMSAKNMDVVHAVIGRWNAGNRDFSVIAEFCDPAIKLESPFSSVVGEPYQGYAGMEQWTRDVDEQFSDWRINHDDVREVGDEVIAIGTIHGRGRASGVGVEFPFAMVAHFGRDHRITRVRIFRDVHEALEAAGLSDG